jgi:hypothetical protein
MNSFQRNSTFTRELNVGILTIADDLNVACFSDWRRQCEVNWERSHAIRYWGQIFGEEDFVESQNKKGKRK